MTRLKLIAPSVAAATLAACAGTAPAPNTAAGQTYDELRASYPDLSAIEFSLLDDNNDGVVDAEEARAISDDDVPGVVGEVDVRDN